MAITPKYYRKRQINTFKKAEAMNKPWELLNTHEKGLIGKENHPSFKQSALGKKKNGK